MSGDLRSRMNDDIEPRREKVAPPAENIPYPASSLVSDHGVADLPAERDAKTAVAELVRENEEDEVATGDSHPLGINRFELPAMMEPVVPGEPFRPCNAQTVNLFRPLARRRLSTRRPFAVLIRSRNPWTFFRRLLLG